MNYFCRSIINNIMRKGENFFFFIQDKKSINRSIDKFLFFVLLLLTMETKKKKGERGTNEIMFILNVAVIALYLLLHHHTIF